MANLRLGTASSPFITNIAPSSGRRKRSSFNFPQENGNKFKSEDKRWSRNGQQFGQRERSLPSFFPQNPFVNPPPSQPKTCSWTFNVSNVKYIIHFHISVTETQRKLSSYSIYVLMKNCESCQKHFRTAL